MSILPRVASWPLDRRTDEGEDGGGGSEPPVQRWWNPQTTKQRVPGAETRKARLKREAEEQEAARWWSNYHGYLNSEAWSDRRKLVLERDNHRCQACLDSCTGRAVEVHHTDYRYLGDEPLWTLRSVCRQCHERITEMDRAARRSR